MERTLIAPGVHLSCDPAEKFNRCRISIHFAFPAQRKTATAHALLPLVMERGYADCPDMTRLTKKLAKPAKEPVAAPLPSALPVEVEESLKQALGSEVRVAYHDGKGKLTVHFYSDDQLKAFANLLGQYNME